MKKIKIGIPRALLYFRYKYLWETFFKELGCEVILSPETNKKILADGINYSIDESCLSAKIYMGHVYSLINKVDYILIPRFCSFGFKEMVCTKFNAIYDVIRNTFPDVSLIHYNIDVLNKAKEFGGFLKMGKMLNKNIIEIILAYKKAKRKELIEERKNIDRLDNLINCNDKLKMLIVSHPYNVYDKLLGFPIIKYLESEEIIPIYADKASHKECIEKSKNITNSLHWTYSKELVGAIEQYKDKIDGIIFISTFPCGPDSLVNELCLRKVKKIPMLNLILEELQGEVGLQTRIESFIDIIKSKKMKGLIHKNG